MDEVKEDIGVSIAMEVSKMVGLFHGKFQLEMDDWGVSLFQETTIYGKSQFFVGKSTDITVFFLNQ